jgi:hypothetical protein
MGHQRLGEIPKTLKWTAVVEKIGNGLGTSPSSGSSAVSIESIARELLVATEDGLLQCKHDSGLQYAVFVLTQVVLSARQQDWQAGLADMGIKLSADATIIDLTSEVHRVIDDHRRTHRGSVTVGEMAQQAAGEALSYLAKDNSVSLFGSGRDELQQAIRKLSTKAGFSDLGQRFFGNFTARFLDFYASKIVTQYAGKTAFPNAGDVNDFKQSLFSHCHQSAGIVHDFCGQWYSKTEWERGIDAENTAGLVTHAIDKLRDELKLQRGAKA